MLMYEPRASHDVGTQQSMETARRSRSSFALYHRQRRSPVETPGHQILDALKTDDAVDTQKQS